MDECSEIAENFKRPDGIPENFTMDDVLAHVNTEMGEYGGYTINANIAESLYYRLKRERDNRK